MFILIRSRSSYEERGLKFDGDAGKVELRESLLA